MKGTDCSVKKFELLIEEEYDQGLVQRSQYEYMPTGKFLLMAQKRRKSIALVCKETSPKEPFTSFTSFSRNIHTTLT